MQITFADTLDQSIRLHAAPVAKDAMPGDAPAAVREGAKAARFSGKTGQVFESFAEAGDQVKRHALVGIGDADKDNRESALEKAGAALVGKYLRSGEEAVGVDLSGSGLSADEAAAFLLGMQLRSWGHDAYRTKLKDEQKISLERAVVTGAPEGTQAAWEKEEGLATGIAFTKELVTEPANIIYPESFVERCQQRFEGTGAEISFLTEDEMREMGMGALCGVSQGSVRDARLLVIKWMGGKEGEKPTIFVGKGVTFDTGGISLKPPQGMEDMKWDMGGAGAVAGAMLGLATRKAGANVIGICGLVENMPDANAQRPGDVVTTLSGQTVEVINTDAEGRLVLCDALTWAQREFKPAAIVDFATLTGAIIISLGNEYGGLFSNDDGLAGKLLEAGKSTGDKMWRFPLSPAYDKLIDSPIADMKNVGPRGAGSITAAQYLQRFIEDDTPWAHCDIAGMVFADKAGATWDKGATGFGVRLMDRYVRDNLEA
ncbi:leucyl aminopeptidase [Paraurantiacibacter namhicola]|uniref:Probable cytosol aminopeptidase n=1 Tax=Paraurantiacibacter namhicola TaxID=645517 RepID=A0A1C7DAB2_9SPHN|nr:leucyl aminopeptidase [Paraurantiacibacter namhicola]ANU08388.1 Cytosol aminopeptidase [Paraurantiacibacter namhicola]